MENRAYAMAAGLFVLLLAALVVAGALWLGGAGLRGVPYDVIADTSVAGLRPGAPVRVHGVDAGKVDSIGPDPLDPRRVLVRISVARGVQLMRDTYATLSYLGVTGLGYVELDDEGRSREPLLSSAAAPARIPMRPSWPSQIGGTAEGLLQAANTTLHRLDMLLSDENIGRASQLLVRLDAGAAQVAALAGELQPLARRLDHLITDADDAVRSTSPLVHNLNGLVSDVRTHIAALDDLGEGARATGQAARNVEHALVQGTLPRVDALVSQLSRDADALDQVLHEVRDRPQSLIFGAPPPPPGPGEPGFQAAPPRVTMRKCENCGGTRR